MSIFTTETIDAFLAHCEARAMSPETIRAYRSDLNTLHDAIGDCDDFEDQAARWLNVGRVTWKPRTTNRKLAVVREMGKFIGIAQPLHSYLAPTPERAQPHPLPRGLVDLKAMMASATSVHRQALVALCGLCGLRVSEAVNVAVEDFDFEARTLHVRGGKGAKDRVLPVSESAWEHLFPCINATRTNFRPMLPWGNRRARQILTEIGLDADISRRVSSHDLRSTMLTAMYAATKDIRSVQMIAGHSSSATTETYIGVSMDTMRDGVNLVAI